MLGVAACRATHAMKSEANEIPRQKRIAQNLEQSFERGRGRMLMVRAKFTAQNPERFHLTCVPEAA
eukprot:2537036-Pleurochrysis_carterae.AAC.2